MSDEEEFPLMSGSDDDFPMALDEGQSSRAARDSPDLVMPEYRAIMERLRRPNGERVQEPEDQEPEDQEPVRAPAVRAPVQKPNKDEDRESSPDPSIVNPGPWYTEPLPSTKGIVVESRPRPTHERKPQSSKYEKELKDRAVKNALAEAAWRKQKFHLRWNDRFVGPQRPPLTKSDRAWWERFLKKEAEEAAKRRGTWKEEGSNALVGPKGPVFSKEFLKSYLADDVSDGEQSFEDVSEQEEDSDEESDRHFLEEEQSYEDVSEKENDSDEGSDEEEFKGFERKKRHIPVRYMPKPTKEEKETSAMVAAALAEAERNARERRAAELVAEEGPNTFPLVIPYKKVLEYVTEDAQEYLTQDTPPPCFGMPVHPCYDYIRAKPLIVTGKHKDQGNRRND